jgi:spore germination protein KA
MKLKNIFLFSGQQNRNDFTLKYPSEEKREEYRQEQKNAADELRKEVSAKLSDNLTLMQSIYTHPQNNDFIIRHFELHAGEQTWKAFAVYIDGMVDRALISNAIINPLQMIPQINSGITSGTALKNAIASRLISVNQLTNEASMEKIVSAINIGCCVVFVDEIAEAFIADVKSWEHRPISTAENERTIEGPKEAFNEILRMNTALIRKILNTQKLVIEMYKIGTESKTLCALMYIKDIANESLIEESRRRLNGIRVDYLIGTEELLQYIEENTFMLTPQLLSTERPDRVARELTEGRIAMMVHGSPTALIAPTNFFELLYSPEDMYNRFFYTNLIKVVRMIGVLISLFLPTLYIMLTLYHQEMIPTFLLYTIQSAQSNVPFSTIWEIVIMEFAFELIREAGLRVPGPIGPTLGIIGALILGQASVAANIISPVAIIIVAITGIGSFATTNYSLGLSFRFLRFVFMFLASVGGILGLVMGIIVYLAVLVTTKSFGVPMLSPIAPKSKSVLGSVLFVPPIWKFEQRSDFLNTKRNKRQPKISRAWDKTKR